MLQCVVKNSFLTLEVVPDASEAARVRGPLRARSADSVFDDRAGKWQSEAEQASLERLNDILTRSQQSCQGEPQDEAPSVDELRQLQRRLEEVTGKMPLEKRRVLSSSSVSTMVSDCEEAPLRPLMPRPWSSGSVSTMVSDFWEDALEEGGLEFGPIFEEDTVNQELGSLLGAEHTHLEADGQRGLWQRGFEYQVSTGKVGDQLPWADTVHTRTTMKDFTNSCSHRSGSISEQVCKGNVECLPTTMMIRNIPNRYTQRDLSRELEGMGFGNSFDFLFLPVDKVTMCNAGYAFVNFVDHCWAERCMKVFDNYSFKKSRKARGKVATVSVAHIQGLQANVRYSQSTAASSVSRSKQRGFGNVPSSAGTD